SKRCPTPPDSSAMNPSSETAAVTMTLPIPDLRLRSRTAGARRYLTGSPSLALAAGAQREQAREISRARAAEPRRMGLRNVWFRPSAKEPNTTGGRSPEDPIVRGWSEFASVEPGREEGPELALNPRRHFNVSLGTINVDDRQACHRRLCSNVIGQETITLDAILLRPVRISQSLNREAL